LDEVSYVDRLAKVAFQVDPTFTYEEEAEAQNPELRFTATLGLGEKFP
jgi:hypothetical protein